jgi:hypothetical protein
MEQLYVIATIFNPASYKTRTDLYYQFEAHMKNSGVNLITIECIYGDNNETFNVTRKDRPDHIQLKANHPLWHKENLINLAIKKLPDTWRYVLWLDADIEFLESDWSKKVLEAFQKYEIIQVFKFAHFLGPEGEPIESHFSFTYSIVEELPISKKHYQLFYPHPGYGWGMKRKAYEDLNGLIDWSILGSGDSHMAFSMIGRSYESLGFPSKMYTENYWKSLEKWENKVKIFYDEKKIGYADCNIKHYFHGYRQDRQYLNRMKILIENNYDPVEDLILAENGLFQLKESRKELIENICNYFSSRKEDNRDKVSEIISTNFILRTAEEILEAALYVKKLISIEMFKNVSKKFSRKPKEIKRSKSSDHPKKKKKTSKPKRPNQKKVLIIEISSDINNFLEDSDGDDQSSTYGERSDSDSLSGISSIDDLFAPKMSRKASLDEKLISKCGTCYSNTKKPSYYNNQSNNNNNNHETKLKNNENASKPSSQNQNAEYNKKKHEEKKPNNQVIVHPINKHEKFGKEKKKKDKNKKIKIGSFSSNSDNDGGNDGGNDDNLNPNYY